MQWRACFTLESEKTFYLNITTSGRFCFMRSRPEDLISMYFIAETALHADMPNVPSATRRLILIVRTGAKLSVKCVAKGAHRLQINWDIMFTLRLVPKLVPKLVAENTHTKFKSCSDNISVSHLLSNKQQWLVEKLLTDPV